MAGLADVVHDDRAADLAGVVDDDVAKTHDPLRNRGRDGYILDLAQRDVFRFPCDQAFVDLEFRVGDCVPNHIATDVVVSRDQQ